MRGSLARAVRSQVGVILFAASFIPLSAGRASASACFATQKPTWAPVGNVSAGTGVKLYLNGVSAASASDAWAVGGSIPVKPVAGQPYFASPVAYHWRGSRWKAMAMRPRDAQLYAVADLGPGNTWAVGSRADPHAIISGGPLIEHWDGKTWTVVPSPTKTLTPMGWIRIVALNAVSVVSARDIWAVGEGSPGAFGPNADVTEHWDGSSWTIVNVTSRVGNPNGIEALGPGDVWVSGLGLTHFDGATWQMQRDWTQGAVYFDASSESNFWLETYSGRMSLQRGDGTSWTPVPMPSEWVYSIATTSPIDTWVLGSDRNVAAYQVEHWDGQGWINLNLFSVSPTLRNRYPRALTTVPGTSSVWIVGSSGQSPTRPMFLLATC